MYDKLAPIIEDGKVINLEDILKEIQSFSDYEILEVLEKEIKEYLVTVKVNTFLHEDLEKIVNLSNIRINELKNTKETEFEIINNIIKVNPNLSAISLIETSKEYNDSKVDMAYLKYINKEGKTQLLEVPSGSELLEYFKNNIDLLTTISSEELFNELATRKYIKLDSFTFDQEKEIKEKQEELYYRNFGQERIINSKDLIDEQNVVRDYIYRTDKDLIPTITFNSYGERIYIIGDEVIKFRDKDGKREMEIISSNEYDKTKEVNKTDNTNSNEISNISLEKPQETNFRASAEAEQEDLLSELEFRGIFLKYISNEVIYISEKNQMFRYIQNYLVVMENNSLEYESQSVLDQVIIELKTLEIQTNLNFDIEAKNIINKYDSIIFNIFKEKELSEENAKKQGELKILELKNPDSTRGAILSVVIIEASILLGILISVIALAKR